jgi:hypothetical protein
MNISASAFIFMPMNTSLCMFMDFIRAARARAEILIENGLIVGIRILPVMGMKPLTGRALGDFKLLVSRKAEDIVRK